MLDHLALRMIARAVPVLVPGHRLHHEALAQATAGHAAEAERLFEAAAAAYRREWAVEPMARLRVHQRMVKARAGGDAVHEADAMLEIVRALNKLDQMESLEAPFALRDAREVLSEWLAASRDVGLTGEGAAAAGLPPAVAAELATLQAAA
jgi:hypothetical protein